MPSQSLYSALSTAQDEATQAPLLRDTVHDIDEEKLDGYNLDDENLDTSYGTKTASPPKLRSRNVLVLTLSLACNLFLALWFVDLVAKRANSIEWNGDLPPYSEPCRCSIDSSDC